MSERARYTAKAVRAGAWWAIEVPEVEGTFTQARRLDQVENVAREAVALMLDVAQDSFDISVEYDVPAQWAALLESLKAAQDAQAAAEYAVSMALRQVAASLHNEGLPMRDVGALMGRSTQRISQLINDISGPAAKALADISITLEPARIPDQDEQRPAKALLPPVIRRPAKV